MLEIFNIVPVNMIKLASSSIHHICLSFSFDRKFCDISFNAKFVWFSIFFHYPIDRYICWKKHNAEMKIK